jgi:uncharacterized membrane protein
MSKELEKDTKKKSTKKSTTKKATPKKTTEKKSTFNISLEEADSFYHVSLLAQAVCVIGILIISILAIFENSFMVPIEVLIGITLLIMAFNNSRLFKRKGMTWIYLIFGIICFVIGILGYFGVTI